MRVFHSIPEEVPMYQFPTPQQVERESDRRFRRNRPSLDEFLAKVDEETAR